MKPLFAIIICLLASGTLSAQDKTAQNKTIHPGKGNSGTASKKVKNDGPAVGGYILDAKRHPLPDVQAFIYAPDSSIIASGHTDATGHYETNAVPAGTYTVRIVYTNANKISISGVVIKKGIVPISISVNEPAADTVLPFSNFVPVVEKKKSGASKK